MSVVKLSVTFSPRAKRPKGSVFLPEEVHEKGHESFSLVPKKARDPAWRKVTKFSASQDSFDFQQNFLVLVGPTTVHVHLNDRRIALLAKCGGQNIRPREIPEMRAAGPRELHETIHAFKWYQMRGISRA